MIISKEKNNAGRRGNTHHGREGIVTETPGAHLGSAVRHTESQSLR